MMMNLKRPAASYSHRHPTVSRRRRSYLTPSTPTTSGEEEMVPGRSGPRSGSRGRGQAEVVSARKLAAELWQLRLAAGVSGCNCGSCPEFEPDDGHVSARSHCDRRRSGKAYGAGKTDLLRSSKFLSCMKHAILFELDSSLLYPKYTMEGATKWDSRRSRMSSKAYCYYSYRKLNDVQINELLLARLRAQKLEAECRHYKKKADYLRKKLGEERKLWQRREHQKIRAVVDDLKNELSRERIFQKKMKFVRSKLGNELANAKSSVKQLRQDYEEEKKGRELLEEVCNELAKKIAEDKAEVEALKLESIKIQEEMEEERNLLELAEAWREERVQMKLVDAKLALEQKYVQMNELLTELEAFLKSRSTSLDVVDLRKAELITQAAKSVNLGDMKEFSYAPPSSGDTYSIFYELLQIEATERNAEPHNEQSPSQERASSLKPTKDDDDRVSTYSPEGIELSANGLTLSKNAWLDSNKRNENSSQVSPNTQISDVCSVSGDQSLYRASSISKLWRSSQTRNEHYKVLPDDGIGKISSSSASSVLTTSQKGNSCEDRHEPQDFRRCNSSQRVNPHVTRGMKGFVEWPRGIQKNSLKAKVQEAKMQNQKVQLRSFLRQKI